MKKEYTAQVNGIGFTGGLTIAFITLKLTGVVAWSWLWVLSPIWIPFALVCAILLVMVAYVVIGTIKSE